MLKPHQQSCLCFNHHKRSFWPPVYKIKILHALCDDFYRKLMDNHKSQALSSPPPSACLSSICVSLRHLSLCPSVHPCERDNSSGNILITFKLHTDVYGVKISDYSQTCLEWPLSRTTPCLQWLVLGPPKSFFSYLTLSRATTCCMWQVPTLIGWKTCLEWPPYSILCIQNHIMPIQMRP